MAALVGARLHGQAQARLIANSTSYSYYPENGLLKTETHQKAEDNTTYTTTYTYDFLGRLSTRLTRRCITTTYAYVPGSGELQSVSYSPAGTGFQMSYSYDRMGHIQTVIDAAGTRTFHYRASDYQLDYEDLPSLTYGLNCSLNNLYDTHNRLDGHQFITPTSNNSFSSTYAFDSASGLLDIVATPLSTAPFAYTYTPNSHLGNQLHHLCSMAVVRSHQLSNPQYLSPGRKPITEHGHLGCGSSHCELLLFVRWGRSHATGCSLR